MLTSSMAAVHFAKNLTPDSVIDETFFSDPDVIRNIPTIVSAPCLADRIAKNLKAVKLVVYSEKRRMKFLSRKCPKLL